MELSKLVANPTSSLISGSNLSTAIVLIIIVLILSRRMYRGIKGTKFSMRGLVVLPLIYIVLTLLFFAEFPFTITDIAITIAAIAAGVLSGLRFGQAVTFFQKEDVTYYKRSPFIMGIWIVAYVARFGLELMFPTSFIINFVVEILLGFSSGLLLGESIHINRKYTEHKASVGKT
jgi:hypothetical protein